VDEELAARQKANAEAEEAKKTQKKVKKALPKVGRKVKALPDAESWKKVRIGLFMLSIACWIWLCLASLARLPSSCSVRPSSPSSRTSSQKPR